MFLLMLKKCFVHIPAEFDFLKKKCDWWLERKSFFPRNNAVLRAIKTISGPSAAATNETIVQIDQ